MKISFDIDNTLIPYSDEFEVESKSSILHLFVKEKLRVGTTKLLKKLQDENHEIWIYTTSFRPIWKLKLTFAKYGLYPKGFINQRINLNKLKRHGQTVSKNPKLFNIDLHVDDSEGVRREGEKKGFETVIVETTDQNWVVKVLNEVKRKHLNLDWQFKELILTLIALKSDQQEQKEIYGYGDSTTEMVEDFFIYYENQKKNWIELGYLQQKHIDKLDYILKIIEDIGKDKDSHFWTNQKESEDAKIIKGLSIQILESLGKGELVVEVERKNEYDENGNFIIQKTNTRLKDKNEL